MDGMKWLERCGAGSFVVLSAFAMMIGCAGGSDREGSAARSVLQPTDFADASIVREQPARPAATSAEVVDGSEATLVTGGPPPRVQQVHVEQPTGGAPVVVDEKVGQINGEPVYAGEYLTRMEARLRADARRMDEYQWRTTARKLLEADLQAYVRDRLLSADFRQSMSGEQRQGLRFFIEQLRDRERLLAGGVEQQANESLLETEGMTLDEKVRSVAEREFRFEQLRREIYSKLHVSRRDIEQYYRQNLDKYAPPPTAKFRAILVPVANEETIRDVETAIANGEEVGDISGVRVLTFDRVVSREGFGQTKFFDDDAVNNAARSLQAGHCSEPVTVRENYWWLCLDEVVEVEPTPLYKVQEEIEQVLRTAQFEERYDAYFAELEGRSNLTRQSEMVDRLVEYAYERFYLPVRRAEASANS